MRRLAQRRRRGVSPGGRRGRAIDLGRADPHHRNQHLSHRAAAQRDAAPCATRRGPSQAVSGQQQRSLRQESQRPLDRGRRSRLRPHDAAALVLRRVEGDRRISGPGLLARASPAGGDRPLLQRGGPEAIGPLRHGAAAAGRIGPIGRPADRSRRWSADSLLCPRARRSASRHGTDANRRRRGRRVQHRQRRADHNP